MAWLGWFCSVCRLLLVAHLFFDCVGFALRMGQFALLVLHCALVNMRMRAYVRARACVRVCACVCWRAYTHACALVFDLQIAKPATGNSLASSCGNVQTLGLEIHLRRFTNSRTGNSEPTFSHLHPAAEDVHDVRYQDRCANGIDSNSEQCCSMGYFLRNGCWADG